jgi:DNA polymerase (family X)
MTRRLIAAMEHPCVNIIGHPTTRSLGRRPLVDFDVDAVFAAAARTGTALEINAFPDRLDLDDALVRRARDHGVVFAIGTDAHSSCTSTTTASVSPPPSAAGSRRAR